MITRLRKRNNAKTPKAQNGIRERFKKPLIRIIDSTINKESNKESNNESNKESNNESNNDPDSDEEISFNTTKISSVAEKFKSKKGEMKKSIMSNANIMKELLIKAVDKHKIELCTQMASQLVEVYNNKQIEKNNTVQNLNTTTTQSKANVGDASNTMDATSTTRENISLEIQESSSN